MKVFSASIATATLLMVGAASAQTMMTGTISLIRTGWNDDSFAVVTVEAMPNPAGCARNDGYITHTSLPGYDTYYAAALTAYIARKRVVLVAHDSECFGSWPKLIGINLIQE